MRAAIAASSEVDMDAKQGPGKGYRLEITTKTGERPGDWTMDHRPDHATCVDLARSTGGPGAQWALREAAATEPVATGSVGDRLIGAWASTLEYGDLREFAQDHTNRETMAELGRRFHSLEKIAGVEPFDPTILHKSARDAHSTATRHCCLFLLHVWNRGPWKAGKFEVTEALSCWDDKNRAAFLWAASPWWA